jgi:hypothetical protein
MISEATATQQGIKKPPIHPIHLPYPLNFLGVENYPSTCGRKSTEFKAIRNKMNIKIHWFLFNTLIIKAFYPYQLKYLLVFNILASILLHYIEKNKEVKMTISKDSLTKDEKKALIPLSILYYSVMVFFILGVILNVS